MRNHHLRASTSLPLALWIAACAEPAPTAPDPEGRSHDPASTAVEGRPLDGLVEVAQTSTPSIPAGWRMPWRAGTSYAFTGGPHSGSSLTPCAHVSLAASSGLDFGLSQGSEVLTVEDGTLRDWGDNGSAAPQLKWFTIDHGNGWSTRYWHLGAFDPSVTGLVKGQAFLSQGRVLGTSGVPSGGAHLHLELRRNNAAASWHGQVLDGYRVNGMPLQVSATQQLNYQGTLTQGTITTANYNHGGCSSAAVVRTAGTTTIDAGSNQGVGSTNSRRTANEPNFIADQGSASFTRLGPAQHWSSAAAGYGGQMWWISSNGSTPRNSARWYLPSSMQAGFYKIYAYVPRINATTRRARYQVFHNGTSVLAPEVDQSINFDVWVRVGASTQTYYFNASGAEYVELSDATLEPAGSTLVGVDALIFVRTSGSPPTCGSTCTGCVLGQRTDILPFYAANGWDTSCGNRDAIVANWCSIDPTGCVTAKSGPTCQSSCIAPTSCGNTCTACVLQQRTDILPFYAANGWDTTCGNRNAIVANWCSIDPAGCAAVKTGGACRSSCGL
jgi:murein DD-endopeptidase MepM/ murein hydrolase activator NlpD